MRFHLVVYCCLRFEPCSNLLPFSHFEPCFHVFGFTSKQMYPKGRMSHHFREMREGDTLAVKGPRVHAIPVEMDMV